MGASLAAELGTVDKGVLVDRERARGEEPSENGPSIESSASSKPLSCGHTQGRWGQRGRRELFHVSLCVQVGVKLNVCVIVSVYAPCCRRTRGSDEWKPAAAQGYMHVQPSEPCARMGKETQDRICVYACSCVCVCELQAHSDREEGAIA